MKKRKLRKNVIFIAVLAFFVIVFCVVCGINILRFRHRNNELKERQARLEELLNNEEIRKRALEDEEAYIQTTKYIEEKAKSIGYVYPDEIIFRKND